MVGAPEDVTPPPPPPAYLEDSTRDGDPLLLVAGELHTLVLVAQLGVVATRKGAHELVRVGLPSGPLNLLRRAVRCGGVRCGVEGYIVLLCCTVHAVQVVLFSAGTVRSGAVGCLWGAFAGHVWSIGSAEGGKETCAHVGKTPKTTIRVN